MSTNKFYCLTLLFPSFPPGLLYFLLSEHSHSISKAQSKFPGTLLTVLINQLSVWLLKIDLSSCFTRLFQTLSRGKRILPLCSKRLVHTVATIKLCVNWADLSKCMHPANLMLTQIMTYLLCESNWCVDSFFVRGERRVNPCILSICLYIQCHCQL